MDVKLGHVGVPPLFPASPRHLGVFPDSKKGDGERPDNARVKRSISIFACSHSGLPICKKAFWISSVTTTKYTLFVSPKRPKACYITAEQDRGTCLAMEIRELHSLRHCTQ